MAMVGQASQGSSELSPPDIALSYESSQKQHHNLASEPCSSSSNVYPNSLATHLEVVADKDLFYDTLNKFHAALGTRLMIPTIGGKELDLHLFYIEVTSRGGLEQVIKDRKWKEITLAFDFPPTTTSASFVLRKYYIMLLHHYEQVYFFGSKGQLVSPAVSFAGSSPGPALAIIGVPKTGLQEGENKRKRSETPDLTQVQKGEPGAFIGSKVTGLIDGKFEHGYLVSVNVGSELLKGVLYHVPPGTVSEQAALVPNQESGGGANTLAVDVRQRQKRRHKDEVPKKDPNAPKPNRSGYNFFFQAHYTELKAFNPYTDKAVSRMIGDSWNKISDEKRAIYQEMAVKDKERYKKEMEDYQRMLQSRSDYGTSAAVREDGSSVEPSSSEYVPETYELSVGEMDSTAQYTDCKFGVDDLRRSTEAEEGVFRN